MANKLLMIKTALFFSCLVMAVSCNSNGSRSNFTTKSSKIVKYKSDEINELILNFQDSTYTYKEIYTPKAGEDVGYENDSKGKFLLEKDTLTFISQMPSEADVKKIWKTITEYLPLYPTKEQIEDDFVKIYFDNISEPEYYSAYAYKNGKLEHLKIKEYKYLENTEWLITEKDTIPLFKYLLIEKPSNNKLLILDEENEARSYYFDFDQIPFRAFHFYTRAYWGYFDFTGLKFIITGNELKLTENNRLNRFKHSSIEKTFIEQ